MILSTYYEVIAPFQVEILHFCLLLIVGCPCITDDGAIMRHAVFAVYVCPMNVAVCNVRQIHNTVR